MSEHVTLGERLQANANFAAFHRGHAIGEFEAYTRRELGIVATEVFAQLGDDQQMRQWVPQLAPYNDEGVK